MPKTHDFTISRSTGAPYCDPPSKHVKQDDVVRWTPDETVEHWAVVFGPTAPIKKKVLRPGDNETTIDAKRELDPHKHKYTLVVFTGKDVEFDDPELIVDA